MYANNPKRHDEAMELLFELIEACLNEDGYKVTNFTETTRSTSAYGGMFITLPDGRRATLTADFIREERDDD